MRSSRFTVISLGGGVQSSVMALMANEGAFDRIPDCAIFADTRWGPLSTYEHLTWLRDRLSFPPVRRGQRTKPPRGGEGLETVDAAQREAASTGWEVRICSYYGPWFSVSFLLKRGTTGSRRTLTQLRQSRYHGSESWPGDAANTPGRGSTCRNR